MKSRGRWTEARGFAKSSMYSLGYKELGYSLGGRDICPTTALDSLNDKKKKNSLKIAGIKFYFIWTSKSEYYYRKIDFHIF